MLLDDRNRPPAVYPGEKGNVMYKVTFEFFIDNVGEWKADYLDNNGNGFSLDDANYIAYQLKQNGNRKVKVEEVTT